jgi:hypothetical protein
MRRASPFLAVLTFLAAAALPASAAGEKDASLLQALKTRRVAQVVFKDHTLDQVVQWTRTATGFNYLVQTNELAKAGIDTTSLTFTLELEDVTVWALLETLFEPHGMAVKVEGNIVRITSKAAAAGKPITRLYGISHITWRKVDFIAPDVNLKPSGFTGEEYEPEVVVENDPLATGDAVAELVKDIVAPGEWDTEGWSIRATDSYLVIRAPRSVHARMDHALAVIASLK